MKKEVKVTALPTPPHSTLNFMVLLFKRLIKIQNYFFLAFIEWFGGGKDLQDHLVPVEIAQRTALK